MATAMSTLLVHSAGLSGVPAETMRGRSGFLVNEGWTGQRKEQTCNVFTTEIRGASLKSGFEVLSPPSNQFIGQVPALGKVQFPVAEGRS